MTSSAASHRRAPSGPRRAVNALGVIIVAFIAVVSIAASLAIALGGPAEPPPMPSINDPFNNVDFSDLPAPRRFTARDGTPLSFRAYAAAGDPARGSVVLVHGSSASSSSMHVMAKAFAAAGYATYALDIRGHGASGTRGRISYVGQLEDDMADFVQATKPVGPATLAGFSSGAGFVLRFAGGAGQRLFANYLLLSPFISQDAPTYRPSAGGWVTVGVPRYLALSILNGFGVHAFNNLPVTRFALAPEARALLTPAYSFALAQNFRPQTDYLANIRAIEEPFRVIVGQKDELFYPDKFASVFESAGKHVPVMIVPGVDHIGISLDAAAIQAAIASVTSMDSARVVALRASAPSVASAVSLRYP